MLESCDRWAECFKTQNVEMVENAIKKKFPKMKARLPHRYLLLGESAGGHSAVMILLRHPDLDIYSVELIYPMVGPYRREPAPY